MKEVADHRPDGEQNNLFGKLALFNGAIWKRVAKLEGRIVDEEGEEGQGETKLPNQLT